VLLLSPSRAHQWAGIFHHLPYHLPLGQSPRLRELLNIQTQHRCRLAVEAICHLRSAKVAAQAADPPPSNRLNAVHAHCLADPCALCRDRGRRCLDGDSHCHTRKVTSIHTLGDKAPSLGYPTAFMECFTHSCSMSLLTCFMPDHSAPHPAMSRFTPAPSASPGPGKPAPAPLEQGLAHQGVGRVRGPARCHLQRTPGKSTIETSPGTSRGTPAEKTRPKLGRNGGMPPLGHQATERQPAWVKPCDLQQRP